MSITIKRKIPDKSFIDLIVERLGLQLEDIKKYQSIAKRKTKISFRFLLNTVTQRKI